MQNKTGKRGLYRLDGILHGLSMTCYTGALRAGGVTYGLFAQSIREMWDRIRLCVPAGLFRRSAALRHASH